MINTILKIISNASYLGGSKLLLVFFLIVITTVIELLGISLIVPIISLFLDPTNINKFNYFSNLSFVGDLNYLNTLLFAFFFIFIVKYSTTIFFEYLIIKLTKNWEIKLTIKLIDQYLERSWIKTLESEDSLWKNIITNIPTFINQGISGVLNILKSLFIIVSLFLYLFYEKGIIVVFFFLGASLFFYLSVKFFKNFLYGTSKNYGEYMKKKFDLTSEIKDGLREIKIYDLKDNFLKQYQNNEINIVVVEIIKKFLQILPKILIELICIVIIMLIIFINSDNSENIIPFLGLLTFIIYRSQPLLSSLTSLIGALQVHNVQISEGIKIINSIKIQEEKINRQMKEKKIYFSKNSSIYFNNVNFAYNNNRRTKKIFFNLNLKLKFGKIYGLSGRNGTGKSTFADLLIGLLKPNKGSILINNQNINYSLKNWINLVSYLSQNYFLFNDTIKNNITLSNKKRNIFKKSAYERALRISNLIDELKKLKDHDKTELKNYGKNLSGGQKQRIAIARLIYKNSKIIILDEPTSSLDQVSSHLLIKMLKKIKKDKLILIISHSKEILNKCDELLSIKNFKIEKIIL